MYENVIVIISLIAPIKGPWPSGLSDGGVDNLAHLPPRGVVPRAELQAVRTATVARDDAVAVGRFDVGIEGVAAWHISECGSWGCVWRPFLGEGHDLAKLTPGDIVARPVFQAVRSAGIPVD